MQGKTFWLLGGISNEKKWNLDGADVQRVCTLLERLKEREMDVVQAQFWRWKSIVWASFYGYMPVALESPRVG